MARQAIYPRQLALRTLAALLGAATLLILVGVSQASAIAEPAIWKPVSVTDPTHLVPGSPQNDVQTITVNATKGTFTVTGKAYFTGSKGTTLPLKYNASATVVNEAIQSIGQLGEEVNVTGGPGGPGGGTPYDVEFIGPSAGKTQELLEANGEGLEGGSATVGTLHGAEGEGEIIASATNVGGTTNGGPITIEDTLPKGVTATANGASYPKGVTAKDTYLGGGFSEDNQEDFKCSPHPETERTIRCTFDRYRGNNGEETPIEMVTGDTLIMTIRTKLTSSPESNEVNEVSVSGGGGRPASVTTPIDISNEPTGYGPSPGGIMGGLSLNQAGGHASLTTEFNLNTSPYATLPEEPKDLEFDLPPGLVGNVRKLPTCTMRQVENQDEEPEGCPVAAMVGVATIYFKERNENNGELLTSPIYAIKPAPGEPTAFGFDALLFPVRLDTSVLSEGNYGVRVTAPSLTQEAETFANWVTIWGIPSEHNGPPANPNVHREFIYDRSFGSPDPGEPKVALLTSPQQCDESMELKFETDSWENPGQFKTESTTLPPLDGCEALSMQPSFTMLPDTLEAAAPAGYTMNLVIPQNNEPEALATPTVKTLKVALPVGVVVSPSVAWGLKTCSEAAFGQHSGQLAECPREAQVGEIEVKTPNLSESLKGDVYLAEPQCGAFCTPEDAQDGKMIKLYAQAVSQGESKIIVKLNGEGSINQQTGQITATFENNPPLPFNELTLKLGGGPRAALANPRECRPVTTNLDITPWSSPFTEDSNPYYTFNLNQNCFGPKFEPVVAPATTSIQSGEYSPFTLVFGRSDDEGFLAGLQETLPPGLLGKIKGVTLCPEPGASEGNCPENSLVGTVQALTGPGADPFLVTSGKVYLTGHYKGAPFGMSIVVPAVAGPYTLEGTNGKGDVVVRAAINVNKEDAQLTVTADPLPTELDGVPLQIKVLDVTINRPEFTFNPTSCEPMDISTTFTSQEGATATDETPFQVTNCVGLGFNPRFEVSTAAKTSRADGASLDARLIYPLGKKLANVKNVKVELPKQLPSRLTTLQQACPDHVFNESPEKCPAASRIGQAKASTPILPNLLEGWAYFVSHGGAAFPNLVVVLQDRPDGVRVDLIGETFISKAGITSTTFGTVPDVPISEFELYLPEGPQSALAANGDLCTATNLVMPTIFNGQNGGRLKQNTPVAVTGCPKAAKAKSASKQKPKKKKKKKKKAKKARKAQASDRGGK